MTPGEPPSPVGPADPAAPAPAAEAAAFDIRYTQTFDSAIQAGRSFGAGTYRWYYLALSAGIAIGVYLILWDPAVGIALASVCAVMLVMTRFAVIDRLIRRRRYRDLLDRPVRLRLDDGGMTWEGPQGTTHIPWSSIDEVRTDARMVLFVRDRTLVTYAPATAFASQTEQAEVVAYARARIGTSTRSG